MLASVFNFRFHGRRRQLGGSVDRLKRIFHPSLNFVEMHLNYGPILLFVTLGDTRWLGFWGNLVRSRHTEYSIEVFERPIYAFVRSNRTSPDVRVARPYDDWA